MQHVANWAELLLPIVNETFTNFPTEEKLPDMIGQLFSVRNSTKLQQKSLGRGGIGLMKPWDQTGRQVNYDTIEKGYIRQYDMAKYSNGLEVEREMWDFDQLDDIKDQVRELATSVYLTRQDHAVDVFNYAFSATDDEGNSMLMPNGKPLCASGHTLVPNGSVTVANSGTYSLNAPNLEIVRNLMKKWTDDRGNRVPMRPDLLLVPNGMRKTALMLADTKEEPETSDHGINVWYGNLKVIEWDLLDEDKWFLVDTSKMKRNLIWWNARIPKIEQDGDNFDTEVA